MPFIDGLESVVTGAACARIRPSPGPITAGRSDIRRAGGSCIRWLSWAGTVEKPTLTIVPCRPGGFFWTLRAAGAIKAGSRAVRCRGPAMLGVIGDLLPYSVPVALSPVPIIAVLLLLPGPGGNARGLTFLAGRLAAMMALVLLASLLAG